MSNDSKMLETIIKNQVILMIVARDSMNQNMFNGLRNHGRLCTRLVETLREQPWVPFAGTTPNDH